MKKIMRYNPEMIILEEVLEQEKIQYTYRTMIWNMMQI